MIVYKEGDIFESEAEVLVNPVNCEGVSGAGLALAFKERYPHNQTFYKIACDVEALKPGTVQMVHIHFAEPHTMVANLATKDQWRNPSRLEWVREGLFELRGHLLRLQKKTVAIPALGCGLGGLAWSDVHDLIVKEFEFFDGRVEVYPPQ